MGNVRKGSIEPESLSASEKIVNQDGSASGYFVRFLRNLVTSTIQKITFPVTSVNGKTGDVVIDIPDQTAASSQITIVAGDQVAAHNVDLNAHAYLPREHSPYVMSKRSVAHAGMSWIVPQLYFKDCAAPALWGYGVTLNGITYSLPSYGSASGVKGLNRNVYLSAFYIPHKSASVKAILLPVSGGQYTTGLGNDPNQSVSRQVSLWKSKQTQINGGRITKTRKKGSTASAFTVVSFAAVSVNSGQTRNQAVFQLALADWNAIAPAVGDVVAQVVSGGGSTIYDGLVTAIDAPNRKVTIIDSTSGGAASSGQLFFWEGDGGKYAAHWPDTMIWSSKGFNTDTTFHTEGWIHAYDCITTADSLEQCLGVSGDVGASVACDLTLEEGIYFVAINECVIGDSPTSYGGMAVCLLAGDEGDTNVYGQAYSAGRGLISNQAVANRFEYPISRIPLASMFNTLNATERRIDAVNTVMVRAITDTDTIAKLDDFGITDVFPEPFFTADDLAGPYVITPTVGAGYAAPADSGRLAPFSIPVAFFARFIE